MENFNELKEQSRHHRLLSWIMVLSFLFGSVLLANLNVSVLQVSLFQGKTHEPFDGTAMPFQKAPDWVKLSGNEWNYNYEQIGSRMIGAPAYDPVQLKIPVSDLEWNNPEHDKIRNAKITYPVPYMGNYELDNFEYVGSHLAVDIKLPIGTSIYAIANGIVDKVSLASTGFGKHVVIKHENFPTLDNPDAHETIYSSYSHMSDILVVEGDIVSKGQQIGNCGKTGTATTPHLHFQIDNDLAPWHPFWAFTYAEALDAGYSFFEAINNGLGRERALANTINPMMYVQKYLNYMPSAVEDVEVAIIEEVADEGEILGETIVEEEPEALAEEIIAEEDVEAEEIDEAEKIVEEIVPLTYKFDHDGEFEVGKPEKVKLVLSNLDEFSMNYFDLIVVAATSGEAEFGKKMFTGIDLTDNYFEFFVTPLNSGTLVFEAKMGDTILAVSEPMDVRAFSDVNALDPHYAAIKYLRDKGVIGGYSDGTFKPDKTVSRVEALKMILSAIEKDLIDADELVFSDVVVDAWYSDYVATAYKDGIVKGYDDNTFKPDKTVNKAEFFKILLLAMEVDIVPESSEDPYDDVSSDAWFAPYVQFVKDKNLLDTLALFKPEDGMTRGEVAEAMFRVIILSGTGADRFDASLLSV